MGIPSYFSYLVKNHAQIIQKLTNSLSASKNNSHFLVNHFYLDCNSIIYDAVHHIDFEHLTDRDVTTIISYVLKKIDEYILLIAPNTNIFIAFDGVAPVAKLNQQRERRYKSLYQTQISKSIFKEGKKDVWNTTAITPGTAFMKELNQRVKTYFKDPLRYGVKKIIVSCSDEPGEGEHKLFEYMRRNPEEHSGPDKRTIVYGLDADLIMLSINHLPIAENIYLFRETPHFIQSLNRDLEPNEHYLLDIPQLAEVITQDMNLMNTKSSESHHRLGGPGGRTYDYIFLCFLLGNDFLPHFPALNIRTGGIDKLLNAYKMILGGTSEVLTDGECIHWGNVRKVIEFLAIHEEKYIQEEMKLRDRREKTYYPTDTPENIFKKFDVLPTYERELEKYIQPFDNGWEKRYYEVLFPEEDSGSTANKSHKEKVDRICISYLEGLEWTMKYYTSGCCHWRWNYPYHYPPLLKDLMKHIPLWKNKDFFMKNYCKKNPQSHHLQPLHELVQLCYVLPRQSLSLLSPKLYTLLTTKYSHWYPEDCEYIWAFCKYFWESHVQLPEIPLDELELVLTSLSKR